MYDKRDNFSFEIINFPFMSSNIPANPTYGVYISQLVRICDTFDTFCARHKLLTRRLIAQGFLYDKLCASLLQDIFNLFSKYGVNMKRHALEGICNPLEVRHDLCRHVDTRVCGHRGCGHST